MSSPTAFGVFGSNAATTGPAPGVYGTTASPAGFGVEGSVSSPSGYGVYGSNFVTSGSTAGVYGSTASPAGSGVQGANFATTGGNGVYGTGTTGVYGTGITGVIAVSPSGSGNYSAGIVAQAQSTSGVTFGVEAGSTSPEGYGVFGVSQQDSLESDLGIGPAGLWGDSSFNAGVIGTSDNNNAGEFFNDPATNDVFNATIWAENDTITNGGEVFIGVRPNLLANVASAIIGDPGCGETSGNMGLQLGQVGMSSCSNYTLIGNNSGSTYVNANSGQTVHLRIANADQLTVTTGNVDVIGKLSKGSGTFKIDHPLDPANKYLYHSFVESPDMKNIYDGVAELDGSGEAVITLPNWFQALNKDFRYQLTTIGGYAPVYIAQEVENNQFKIAGGRSGIKVSWQVTGIRQDAFANANPIQVEVEKAPADRGHYLYPEALGQPATTRIGYEAPPPGSEQVAQHRPAFPRRSNASSMPGRMPLSPPAPPTPNLLKPNLPRPIVPAPPRIAPLPHPDALASKPEANQK